MKKFLFINYIFVFILIFSCKELKRNNPYDPSSPNYIGITYKGEIIYPTNTEIRSITINKGIPILGCFKSDGPGYCIIKVLNNTTACIIGGTGSILGTFIDISDLCSDNLNNIFIADSKPYIQMMNENENFSWWSISYTVGIGNLFLEYFNNFIYITNTKDKMVLKYQKNGVFVDAKVLSFTANGEFEPGRVFRSLQNIFIVNNLNKKEIIKMDENLNIVDIINFNYEIKDADFSEKENIIQILTEKAVFKVDKDIKILLKWGDFGEGPGRILNGKLLAINLENNYIYILDGASLKIFGE